jgi:hypothetical protein
MELQHVSRALLLTGSVVYTPDIEAEERPADSAECGEDYRMLEICSSIG